MKQLKILSALLLMFLLSCGNQANKGSEDSAEAELAAPDISAQYRYLGVMYNTQSGKQLNDLVLNGAIAEKYSTQLQTALNITLHFPINNDITSSDTAANWWDENWWESLPQQIEAYIKDFLTDVLSDSIAKGLTEFLSSDEGMQLINDYLNNIQIRANMLIDYGLNALSSEFSDEIKIALAEGGVFAAGQFMPGFSDVFSGLNAGDMIMQGAGMIQNQVNYNKMDKKLSNIDNKLNVVIIMLAGIQQKLEEIQQSLEIIEEKIDKISLKIDKMEEMEFRNLLLNSYQAVTDARDKLETVYSQLNSLANESDKKEYLKNLLITDDSYESAFTSAFNAIGTTQENIEKYLNLDMDTLVRLDRWQYNTQACYNNAAACAVACTGCGGNLICAALCTSACNNKYKECMANPPLTQVDSIKYKIKQPIFYSKISFDDLALMKRLSLERLSLLSTIYTNSDLLKYRAAFADEDLKKLLAIKQKLNDGFVQFLNEVSTMIVNTQNSNVRNLVVVDENGAVVSTIANPGNSDLVAAVNNFLNTSKDHQNYFIASYATILDWEIQLRAHIFAGSL